MGFVGDLEQKALRDIYSGLLRFIAQSTAQWEVRTVSPTSATNADVVRFRDWEPVGIIAVPDSLKCLKASLAGYRLRPRATVSLNRADAPLGPARGIDIYIDDESLAEAAASLLMKRGLTHFAFVDELERPGEATRSRMRGDAFLRLVGERGFKCERFASGIPLDANWSDELMRLAVFLSELPKPCGVMAYADTCAKRIYDACNIARLRIPDHIRVVSVDNDASLCENLSPSLTSIEPDFETCGYLAGRILHDRLGAKGNQAPMRLTYGVKAVVERASTEDVKGGGRIVAAACEIMRLHAADGISVADIAARLRVSRRLLEMRFREVLGVGVAEELRRARLSGVCRQLQGTRLSIGEVAAKSGFSSSSHLNAVFRATYGMTMGEWRLRHWERGTGNGELGTQRIPPSSHSLRRPSAHHNQRPSAHHNMI